MEVIHEDGVDVASNLRYLDLLLSYSDKAACAVQL